MSLSAFSTSATETSGMPSWVWWCRYNYWCLLKSCCSWLTKFAVFYSFDFVIGFHVFRFLGNCFSIYKQVIGLIGLFASSCLNSSILDSMIFEQSSAIWNWTEFSFSRFMITLIAVDFLTNFVTKFLIWTCQRRGLASEFVTKNFSFTRKSNIFNTERVNGPKLSQFSS